MGIVFVVMEVVLVTLVAAALLATGIGRLEGAAGILRDGLPPGTPAPAWHLPDLRGRKQATPATPVGTAWQFLLFADHSLASYPAVVDALNHLAQVPGGPEVIVLSRSSQELCDAMMRTLGMRVPIVRVDPTFYRRYRVRVMPFAFLLDPQGTVLWRGVVNYEEHIFHLWHMAQATIPAASIATPIPAATVSGGARMMHNILILAILVIRATLATVLVIAGGAKIADTQGFAATLLGLGVSPRHPALVRGLAVAFPVIELALGLVVISGLRPDIVDIAVLTLMGFFSIVVGIARVRTPQLTCRCFGALSDSQFGTRGLVRALVLTALAALVVWGGAVAPGRVEGSSPSSALLVCGYLTFAVAAAEAARTIAQLQRRRQT